MKILGLYNNDCAQELFAWLVEQGHDVTLCRDKLDPKWCAEHRFDLAVSYTYRYILNGELIRALHGNVVNLHNSLLPFNRGADPNLWSIAEQTPRGVTLHYVDERLDKGDIICQQMVAEEKGETLKSSYDRLDLTAKKMFQIAFSYYPYWQELRKRPVGRGTYHAVRDGIQMKSVIDSYDMLTGEFKEKVEKLGNAEI